MRVLKRLADNRRTDSLADKLRHERFALFLSLIAPLPRPLSILDLGGTQAFWEQMGAGEMQDVHITLLNVAPATVTRPGFAAVVGDAADLSAFADGQFDVVFSNSVIEHLGTFNHQQRMAAEAQRVGRRYFVQTPNCFFPIEPHFLFPFFQFLPIGMRVFLVSHLALGWNARYAERRAAEHLVRSIRLLSEREMRALFPDARIHREKFAGLTKSFIAYKV
jgi:ubiquinone/menaquinone biosynthesis C-methylase UbiE